MTWALLGTTVLFLSLLAPTLVWLHAEINEGKHLRDRLDEEMKLGAQYRSERDVEAAAHTVTRAQLDEAQQRLALAESQRNDAWRTARDHIAQQIASSDMADAAAIGNRILSAPLPGLRLSDTADGALEKP